MPQKKRPKKGEKAAGKEEGRQNAKVEKDQKIARQDATESGISSTKDITLGTSPYERYKIWEEEYKREAKDWKQKCTHHHEVISELVDEVFKYKRLKIAALTLLADAKEEAEREKQEKERYASLHDNAASQLRESKEEINRLEIEMTVLRSSLLLANEKERWAIQERKLYAEEYDRMKNYAKQRCTLLLANKMERSVIQEEYDHMKNYAIRRLAFARDGDGVRVFIRKGADVSQRDSINGRTLLHIAASLDCDNIAMQLIEARVDVYSRDHYGDMPIHVAVKKGSEGVVQVLVNHDRYLLEKMDDNGRTPAELATSLGKTRLLRHLVGDRKEPLLHMAAASGQEEAYLWLLEAGFPLKVEGRGPAFKYAEVAGFFTLAARLWLAGSDGFNTWTFSIFGWQPLVGKLYGLVSWWWRHPEEEEVNRMQVEKDVYYHAVKKIQLPSVWSIVQWRNRKVTKYKN